MAVDNTEELVSLAVMQGGINLLQVFDNIALGSNGTSLAKKGATAQRHSVNLPSPETGAASAS
ncbi:MAG: hypothetical protein IPG06_22335 [Haliea sp.]|nr:hypothetical protein [Haliea sp.]